MKKLIPAIFLLTTSICFAQFHIDEYEEPDYLILAKGTQAQEYVFNSFLEKKTPQSFDNIMLRKCYQKGFSGYLFEVIAPVYKGVYDSSFFYSEACDDGSWVDSVLLTIEEERMGEEILSLLEDETLIAPPIIEEIEQTSETEQEKIIMDSSNRLKFMEIGNEIFIPQENSKSSVLTHYSNKAAIRLFYDSKYRLIKKELWKMNSVYDARITGLESFEYMENSYLVHTKIIQNESYKTVSKYNQDGLVIEAKKYASIKQDDELEFDDLGEYEAKPLSTTTWKYDSEKRVIEEKIIANKTVKTQKFIYNENGDIYEYYENGSLKIKTEYTKQKGYYTSTIYFDAVNSVKTEYKNYTKIRDIYMANGVETRVKVYE